MFNFSLRLKLSVAFLSIAALLAAVNYYQVLSMQHLSSLFTNLTAQDFTRVNALEDIELSGIKLRDQRNDYQQDVTAHSPNTATQKEAVISQVSDFQQKIQLYLSLAKVDNPNVTQQTIDDITVTSTSVIKNTQSILDGTNVVGAQNALRDAQTKLDQSVTVAITADRKGISSENADIAKIVENLLWTIAALTIFATILAVVMGTGFAAWISRSLSDLRIGAERIANGDFSRTIVVKGHSEIGQLGLTFNRMAARLKESYQRLALARQRDESMLQGMGEGLVATDESGRIVIINRVAARLLGFAGEAAAIGMEIQKAYVLYDPNDKASKPLPNAERPSYMALANGRDVHGVFGYRSNDGKKYLFNISASPVKLEGKVVGTVNIIRDVTKEREIDRMKTEFISLASHQLRTPLSAIKWFSEMLLAGDAGKLKPDQMDFAQNISDSTERMIDLVNALLNISRIESGRIMIDPKPTDLRELVTGITNDLKAKTSEKKQSLIISVHEGLPKINLDPRLIGQVYLNLLTNAIKYTQKGGEITVFISKKDDQIISQVTDNGYGIPKDQQSRIFEKFFRAANAAKVETDGTGLGLYLIKAIVESSGGKIWFESKEKVGSTFWFSIPVSGMKPKKGEVTLDV